MLFNSSDYVLFLPLVLLVYLLLRRAGLRAQNAWLLVASYTFYGWWDWRFLGLLFGTTLNDYLVGLGLERTVQARHRRALILLSIGVNLGVLGFFKYYNFFISSFIDAFAGIGVHLEAPTLKVILPVGISFYTFQALTYTIAVYRREMPATREPIGFFAYVSFFPQLVAGPIERARHLLPQFYVPRVIEPEAFASGLRQMLWGFFCKLVVADNCATVVNGIFAHKAPLPGSIVLLGSVLFAFQIYADFSGYSHIALGTARLFGFELMQNFATPYFSQNHAEFWRRWHISLSTWFRDYVYIPLGGNRTSRPRQAFNLLVTFTLSGLWHGANWTFIVWGVLNGLYVIPRVLIGEPLAGPASSPNLLVRVPVIALRILMTFALTVLAWIFFRSPTIQGAWTSIGEIASPSLLSNPVPVLRSFGLLSTVGYAGLAIAFLLVMEWWQRDRRYALELETQAALITWPACALVFALTLFFRYTGASLDFIYFQF